MTNTMIAGVDLLETEGRLARRHAARFVANGALLIIAMTLGALGVVALLVGVTLAIAAAWTLPGALGVVGSVTAVAAAGVVILAYNKMR